MNFVDKFLEYTKDAESPESYFRWAALTMVSAIVRDRVYIKFPYYTLLPNIYTILLSEESSNTRKGVPLKLARQFIKAIDNTTVITGSATMPAIIQKLAGGHQTEKGKVIAGASGIIIATELTAFIKKDFGAVEKLTDLYDGHLDTDDMTKSSGSINIKNICLSLFAGTNSALVADLYDEKAKEGGLLARSCIIYERRRRFMNSLEFERPKPRVDAHEIISDLKHLSSLSGEFQRSTEYRKLMDHWYTTKLTDDRLTKSGAEGRIHDTARKISMLLCLAELPTQGELVLLPKHMEEAIDLSADLIANLKTFAFGAGRGQNASEAKMVLKTLYYAKDYTMSIRKLMQNMFGDIDKETLAKVLETCQDSGYIRIASVNEVPTVSLTEEFLNIMKKKTE